ncbi:MAG: hypothetical protein LBG52_01140 [Candidatus Peribacteria bacterium]|jgi:hypothetical protein|nr:hypothetical protein [Candidatus Peribacteria bacterium]
MPRTKKTLAGVKSSTSVKKTTKSVPASAVSSTKSVKPLVITKTTKPRVVVERKSLSAVSATPLPTPECCHKSGKKAWNVGLKVFFILLTIANFVLLCGVLSVIKSQQQFQILSNGGKENYEAFKNIYATPEYQSLVTTEVYRMIDNISQTIAENQEIQAPL